MSSFTNFDLEEKILKVLAEIGYQTPTPIQEQAIPKILEGSDIIACAQTGTGKTAAFMLPILHLLSQPDLKKEGGPQVLVLVPTRELAMQVAEEAKKFSKYLSRIKTVCLYGGVPYPPQRRALSSRYEILVATPGRLMDHMEQNRIDFSHLKLLVLDEADRMLDMGFVQAVEHIAAAMPDDRQTLLFSATIDRKILPISKKLQNNPFEIKVEANLEHQNNIEQRLYYVDGVQHKIKILEHILENTEINQSIVFTSTIVQANKLADYLHEKGYHTEALHGDMNQRQRSRTLDKMRNGKIQFLIATDVAARGIDILTLSHIFNFDLPFQPEDFVHRIGRTGRAGGKGIAITFSTYQEEPRLSKIKRLIDLPIEIHTIEGMEPKSKRDSRGPMPSRRPNSRGGFRNFNSREDDRSPRGATSRKPPYGNDRRDHDFKSVKPSHFRHEEGTSSPPFSKPGKPAHFRREEEAFHNSYSRPRDGADRKESGYKPGKPPYPRGEERAAGRFSDRMERKEPYKPKRPPYSRDRERDPAHSVERASFGEKYQPRNIPADSARSSQKPFFKSDRPNEDGKQRNSSYSEESKSRRSPRQFPKNGAFKKSVRPSFNS